MNALGCMTYALMELGAYDDAESCAREALDRESSAGSNYGLFTALENLGLIHLKRGLVDEALSFLTRSCDGFAGLGRFRDLAPSLAYLALATLASGDVALAFEHIARALSHCVEGTSIQALALAVSAKIDLRRGDVEQASRSAERALAIAKTQKGLEHQALIRATHAESLIASARIEEGRAAIAEASTWLASAIEKIEDPTLRHSFTTHVVENARILELAQTWLPRSASR